MLNKSNNFLLIEHFIDKDDFFAGVFENSIFIRLSFTISIILSAILVALFLGIIWFDQIKSDSKRVIINRLFCSGCWLCIGCLFLVHLPDLSRYIFRPLPEFVCFYHHVFKNAFSQQLLILVNLIVIF